MNSRLNIVQEYTNAFIQNISTRYYWQNFLRETGCPQFVGFSWSFTPEKRKKKKKTTKTQKNNTKSNKKPQGPGNPSQPLSSCACHKCLFIDDFLLLYYKRCWSIFVMKFFHVCSFLDNVSGLSSIKHYQRVSDPLSLTNWICC